jgi:GntR family transcriptional repressor for pyruvate dehydrogenase complex
VNRESGSESGRRLERLRLVRDARTADHIVDSILAEIKAGRYRAGDRLPGENSLAAAFGVSRSSIREALRIMEVVGSVKVRPGRGCYVLRGAEESDGSSVWLSWLLQAKPEFVAFLELREAVEGKIATLAAERASEDDLDEIGAIVTEMGERFESGNLQPEEALDLDLRFHKTLARASRSPYLADVAAAALDAVWAYRRGAITIPHRIARSWEGHRQIARALRRRDAAGAAEAMLAHIRKVAEDVETQAPREAAPPTPPSASAAARPSRQSPGRSTPRRWP